MNASSLKNNLEKFTHPGKSNSKQIRNITVINILNIFCIPY